MAKIKIFSGQWTPEATDDLNLVNNHILNPDGGYDKVMMYAEQRMLMTFLTAGIREGRYTAPANNDAKTKIGVVADNEVIDGNAWKYRIMGRIQRAVEIVGSAAIGTVTSGSSTTGGYFSIALRDNMIKPGMNVIFYNGKMARCEGMPTGGPGNYVYYFHCNTGDTFSWGTWVAPQMGTKTCFGGYTSYGERSLKGFGYTMYPDHFINHFTTQRAGMSISGDANARIVWYDYDGQKGWDWEQNAQTRARFLLEDEFQKWHGRSTMKDIYGNLMATPSKYDQETCEPIYEGDGVIPQIWGSNNMDASGVDGSPVYDDFVDMVLTTAKKSNTLAGRVLYCVTGSDGMQTASDLIARFAKDKVNMTMMVTKEEYNKVGGMDFRAGYNFTNLNIAGDMITFIKNPMQDDPERFPEIINATGRLRSSSTFYFLDNTIDPASGLRNMEIRAKGRNGVNRNWVLYDKNGMTGQGKAETSVDAKDYQILKQNTIIVRNTKGCGIIMPAPGI